MFTWYELRTIDLDAAQSFYAAVMGWRAQRSAADWIFCIGAERMGGLTLLPERARAHGAPPHWLGHIAVRDVDACASQFIAAGGEPRGPVRRSTTGDVAVVRDPQGAVLGLSSRSDGPSRAVAWHELHTTDAEQAWAIYSKLFGWSSTDRLELGLEVGPYKTFCWDDSRQSVGGMANTAQLPHIHTHWLFYLAVDDLDSALERVKTQGGTVISTMVFPGGYRIAQCEDSQGAAFALRERWPRSSS